MMKLILNIYERTPETKVIILSAYNEFDYAKQAIAYNVSNYLLKAVDVRELKETLVRLADDISKKRN